MMGSRKEYEQRKRNNAKAIASLTTDPDKINVMINYCNEILIQQMLIIGAEHRMDMAELPRLRDERFNMIDRQLRHPTTVEYRCQQVHILMNTLFGEVMARNASKDFTMVSELAAYLIAKKRPADEIASARGYIVTLAGNYLDIMCCQSDAECVTGLDTISEKFAREGGYRVAIPYPAKQKFDVLQEATALVTISQNCKILTEDRPRVREIGERLNAAGGIEAMRKALMIVCRQFPHGDGREDGWHPAEIESAWDGIGGWRR